MMETQKVVCCSAVVNWVKTNEPKQSRYDICYEGNNWINSNWDHKESTKEIIMKHKLLQFHPKTSMLPF